MFQLQIMNSMSSFQELSQREMEVLIQIAYEKTSFEIGRQLHISHETVNTHRKNIMLKLNVRNTAGLIRRAFETGILRV